MRANAPLIALALLLSSVPADRARADGDEQAREAPAPTYLESVQSGLEAIRAGELDRALELLREAKRAEPQKPQAAYYEAVALELGGDLEGAVEAYRAARVLATHANDARIEARALQGAAMALEASEGKLDQARAAWEELAALLEQRPDVGVASVPASRLEKLEELRATEQAAETTRRAIEAREAELREQEAEKAKKRKKSRR